MKGSDMLSMVNSGVPNPNPDTEPEPEYLLTLKVLFCRRSGYRL